MNQTFQELALLKDIQEVWEVLGPQLFTFMNNSANVARLQVRGGGCPMTQEGGPSVGEGVLRGGGACCRGGVLGGVASGNAAESSSASWGILPSAGDLGKGQGRASWPRVWRWDAESTARTGPRNGKRGDKADPHPPSPAAPQRLLQIQVKGRRRPGPRGQDWIQALQALLDPLGSDYSWQEAHAEVGHLVGMLGRVMEVRDRPLGALSEEPNPVTQVGRRALPWGPKEGRSPVPGRARRGRRLLGPCRGLMGAHPSLGPEKDKAEPGGPGEDPSASDPNPGPSPVREPGQAGGSALRGGPGGARDGAAR